MTPSKESLEAAGRQIIIAAIALIHQKRCYRNTDNAPILTDGTLDKAVQEYEFLERQLQE